ncbi:MAG: YHS domain-containing (seleno)protein [Candidatus Dadabacteria bacterium]
MSQSNHQNGISTTGVLGYDLVSYHKGEKPVRGDGKNVVVFDGTTYLFASEENKKAFERDPERYLPAYGGYCAFGVAINKKFVGDPEVWKIVDGTLYLNLDKNIQSNWNQDIQGNITKADWNWTGIKDKSPDEL